MKHLSPWWKEKGCHGNDNENGATATLTKTVPRQRSGSGNSIEIPMQRRSVRMHAKDGGVIPDSGFPRMDGMAMRTKQVTTRTRCKHRVQLIHRKHSPTDGHLGGYTFEACKRDGSSSMGRSGTFDPRRRKRYRRSQGTGRSGLGVVVPGKRSGTRSLVKPKRR